MTTPKSEHDRISELEAAIPELSVELSNVKRQFSDIQSRIAVTPFMLTSEAALLPGILWQPIPIASALLASFGGFEATAATAGEKVSQAEDLADDAQLVNDELTELIEKVGLDRQLQPQEKTDIKAKADELATAIRNALNNVIIP